jgi:hypothetical protein
VLASDPLSREIRASINPGAIQLDHEIFVISSDAPAASALTGVPLRTTHAA